MDLIRTRLLGEELKIQTNVLSTGRGSGKIHDDDSRI